MPGSRPKRIHKPNVRLPGVREEREEQEKTDRDDVAKKERKKQVEQGKKKRAGETKMREKQEMTAREKKRKSEVDEPTVSSLKSPTNTDLEEEREKQVEQGKKKRAQDGCTVVSVIVVQDKPTTGHEGLKTTTHATVEEEEAPPSVPINIPYPNVITLEGWEQYTSAKRKMIASHYHCPTIPIFEDNYLQLGNGLATSEYSDFVSVSNSIPDVDRVSHPILPPLPPPLGDDATISDEAISEVLGEENHTDVPVEEVIAEVIGDENGCPPFSQPSKTLQLINMHDSLITLNLDDLKGIKSWPTGIQDSSVARLSFDGTHINCDVCK